MATEAFAGSVLHAVYEELTRTLLARGLTVSTMESCTGGLIASLITDTEGASGVLKGAFVTYSNEAKLACGVPAETLERCGVYSEETARAMAGACRRAYGADLGIGVTGSFGRRDPANADSVPGELFFAVSLGEKTESFPEKLAPGGARFEDKAEAALRIGRRVLRILGG